MPELSCKPECGHPAADQVFECPVCERTVCYCNGGDDPDGICNDDPDGICNDCWSILEQDNPSREQLEAIRHAEEAASERTDNNVA